VARCSKGMRQKVGIAQCVLHRPRLLFLDEPMRGLDPMTVHLFRSMLVEMHREGTTIVMSSHLLSEVEQVATRVAIVHRGKLVVQDDLKTLVGDTTLEQTFLKILGPPQAEQPKQPEQPEQPHV
jgi:ABC-2 type transport system ATP-binding protein